MKSIYLFFGLFLLTLFHSCQQQKSKVVAKVYDQELRVDDIRFLYENQYLSLDDSAQIVNQYISDWIEQQILLHESLSDSTVNVTDIDRKVDKYRNELIIYQYENHYIQTHLDTNVSDQEIQAYYQAHKADFQLSDYLVKVLYIKLPTDAPDLNQVEQWYLLKNEQDTIDLQTYAQLYAANFYFDTQHWIYFDDLTKEIPLENINKSNFVSRKTKRKFEDANYVYFLNIIDYKLKNTTSPLDFERNNIKKRLLNIKTKNMRKDLRNNLINNAYENKAVKRDE